MFKKLLPTELLGIVPDSEWALNQGEPSPSSFSQPRQGTLAIAANTAKSTELGEILLRYKQTHGVHYRVTKFLVPVVPSALTRQTYFGT